MDLLSAVRAPRIHSQLLPDSVDVEDHFLEGSGLSIVAGPEILDALISRGHRNVTAVGGSFGVSQFIAVNPDTGEVEAVSDPRKYGHPAAMS